MTVAAQRAHSIAQPVDISALFDNKGTSRHGENDGTGLAKGATFPAEFVPTGVWRHDGVDFDFAEDWNALSKDNIRSDGQVISLPQPVEVSAIHLVAVGDDPRGALHKEARMDLGVSYSDGTSENILMEIRNWWSYNGMNKGPIRAPYHYTSEGVTNPAVSNIFHLPVRIPLKSAGKKIVSVKLPAAGKWNALHVFALSVVPTVQDYSSLQSKVVPAFVRATRRWEDVDGGNAQVVEVGVTNPVSVTQHSSRDAWVDQPITLSLSGATFKTVTPATVSRLMPGDEVKVELLVTPTSTSAEFVDPVLDISVNSDPWSAPVIVEGSRLVHDFTQWSADEDVEEHTAPGWFNDAKFGIFIHWGLYSVPAWADCEEGKYAEWYWFWQNTKDINGPGTYEHHLKTYGADFVHDDFIPLFKADKFDPAAWVNLFGDAGAKYFVFTCKHHDGYALFDTEGTSNRNSLLLGPKRDFTKELMDAAVAERPDLKRGTYYSMPEWYNPLYKKYGRDDGALSFFGGLAKNPYSGKEEPYTGHVDVGDYISGLQVPQLHILADKYKSDLMWGDIGMANDSIPFVAKWYASAAAEGRQVTINNRLGIAGDFVTPEMEKFSNVQPHKWEACQSVDPYSFGYNAATTDDEYRSVTDLVHTLVDIVAKGGNFLLNVGPCADGTIAKPITDRLLEIGAWLKVNGRAIYGTDAFKLLPEVQAGDVHVQFTRTRDALYIISLQAPTTPTFTVPAVLPILENDKVVLLTESGDVEVPRTYNDGVLQLDTSGLGDNIVGKSAYVFEIQYGR